MFVDSGLASILSQILMCLHEGLSVELQSVCYVEIKHSLLYL